jgi:uncharacterized protein (TIGR02246 family)
MKIRIPRHPGALPALALLCAASLPTLSAQETPPATPAVEKGQAEIDKALESLGKAAEKFVTAFNNEDAAAIAALFTPLGEIVGVDDEALVGRRAIEDYYRDFFAGENVPQIALEASDVQFVGVDLAIETGQLHLTYADDEPVRSVTYSVTHSKQADGSWLIAASRTLSDATTLSERIKPLHWMVGEWTLEGQDGLRIDMVIDLDDRENFLLGEALITDAEDGAQALTLRIGWNPATSSVYWWTFDSEGGNAAGSWAQRGEDWMISSTGVTADGESSDSSQTLVRDGDSMVWIATERMLAGESRPDFTYRFVRRAPDPLSLLSPEASGEPGEPAATPEGE